MSEQTPESTESTPAGDTNVDAQNVVVNQAPDGGGVDNNGATEAPAEAPSEAEGSESQAEPEGESTDSK